MGANTAPSQPEAPSGAEHNAQLGAAPARGFTPELHRAYWRTAYGRPGSARVGGAVGPGVRGQQHSARRAWRLGRRYRLARAQTGPWLWLTAWNPRSQVLPVYGNRRRDARLHAQLGSMLQPGGSRPQRAWARAYPPPQQAALSPWPPEPGWWVQGLPIRQARGLLRQYGQWAGLWAPPGGRLRLLGALPKPGLR